MSERAGFPTYPTRLIDPRLLQGYSWRIGGKTLQKSTAVGNKQLTSPLKKVCFK